MRDTRESPCYGMHCPSAEKAMDFLASIGLAVSVVEGAQGFLKRVAIVAGGLQVDPRAAVSDLLHEAGHVAIMPSLYRHYLTGDIKGGMKAMYADIETQNLDPDGPLWRAAIQVRDECATAWAFAAGTALGLPAEQIIQDHEYQGDGDWIRLALSLNSYLGVNGLAHAGFCVVRANPYSKDERPVYPALAYWLQR